MCDGEPSISIKEATEGIITESKHSCDTLEEFTIFFLAVKPSLKEKNAGNLGYFSGGHFVLILSIETSSEKG